jgi:ABC-2 type transport system permease protein
MTNKVHYYKIVAFIKKDFLIESGYKMAFAITVLNTVFPVLSFFFIDKIVDQNTLSLQRYGCNYFSFALVGIAFTTYFTLAVGTFSNAIRRSQMAGCLEAILSSQTSTTSVVLMSSLYSFISAGIQLIIIFLIGICFLKFDISNINILSTLVAFICSLVIFISMGIISAAGTIIFKQGEPFGWIFGGLSSLLGGALFPIAIMPQWLQYLSAIIPVTYALETLRLTILKGLTISVLWPQLLLLLTIAVVLFPASILFFNWAVVNGKKDGSLMQY